MLSLHNLMGIFFQDDKNIYSIILQEDFVLKTSKMYFFILYSFPLYFVTQSQSTSTVTTRSSNHLLVISPRPKFKSILTVTAPLP